MPAAFQGTPISSTKPVHYLERPEGVAARADSATRDALRFLNESHQQRFPGDDALAARIASYELAARMQLSVPEATAIEREPEHIMRLYGADDPRNEHKPGLCKNRSPVLKKALRSGPNRMRASVTGGFAKNIGWGGV